MAMHIRKAMTGNHQLPRCQWSEGRNLQSQRMGSAGSRRLTDMTMRFKHRSEALSHQTTKPPLPRCRWIAGSNLMSRRMGSAGSRRLTDITMRFTNRSEASPHTKPPNHHCPVAGGAPGEILCSLIRAALGAIAFFRTTQCRTAQ